MPTPADRPLRLGGCPAAVIAFMARPLRFDAALAQNLGWRVFLLELPNAVLDF